MEAAVTSSIYNFKMEIEKHTGCIALVPTARVVSGLCRGHTWRSGQSGEASLLWRYQDLHSKPEGQSRSKGVQAAQRFHTPERNVPVACTACSWLLEILASWLGRAPATLLELSWPLFACGREEARVLPDITTDIYLQNRLSRPQTGAKKL